MLGCVRLDLTVFAVDLFLFLFTLCKPWFPSQLVMHFNRKKNCLSYNAE